MSADFAALAGLAPEVWRAAETWVCLAVIAWSFWQMAHDAKFVADRSPPARLARLGLVLRVIVIAAAMVDPRHGLRPHLFAGLVASVLLVQVGFYLRMRRARAR